MQIAFRGLVADEHRHLGQGVEQKGDIRLVPVNLFAGKEHQQIIEQVRVVVCQQPQRFLAAPVEKPLPFDAARYFPERDPVPNIY